jgi:uncharacterized protein (TIGR01244 family)
MNTIRKINDELAIAGQITLEQLDQIVDEGYKSVLNLRSPDEKSLLADEQKKIEFLGLCYVNVPTNGKEINHQVPVHLFQTITELPKPILIHCDNSLRSAIIALLYVLTRHGITYDQAFQQARSMGLL